MSTPRSPTERGNITAKSDATNTAKTIKKHLHLNKITPKISNSALSPYKISIFAPQKKENYGKGTDRIL